VYAFKDDFIKDLEKWLPPEFHDKFTLLNRGKEVLSDPPEPKKTVIYIHFDATGRWVAQITPTKLEALRGKFPFLPARPPGQSLSIFHVTAAKYRKVIILLQKLSVDAYPHRDAGVDSLSWVIVDTDRFITPNTDNQKRVADIYKALLEFHAGLGFLFYSPFVQFNQKKISQMTSRQLPLQRNKRGSPKRSLSILLL